MDLDTNEKIILNGSDLTITGSIISFSTEGLNKNRMYNVSVNASNINSSAVSYTTRISM